jgi:hypothetical protein
MKPVLALIAVEVAQDPEDHGAAEADVAAVDVAAVDEVAVDEVAVDAAADKAEVIKAEGDAFSKRHSGI